MTARFDPRVGAPWSRPLRGRLDTLFIESGALRGNPLGDPHVRPLLVYTPPAYEEAGPGISSIYVLQGMTGQVDMWLNRTAFRPSFIEALDSMYASDGAPPPCVVVFVDCWTSLGGSQYLDSPGTGRYHTYLCDEVVPFVDARYRTLPQREHRGVTGKSSGGYGAMVTPMLRPDLFGALATHSGDALFELCYLPEIPRAVRALRDHYESSYDRFWDDFRSRTPMSKPDDFVIVNEYAMAACYSANQGGSIRFPYDLGTGELIPEVWQLWLDKDPVRMASRHADALRSLRGVYIDAGKRDEWFLDLGAAAFRRRLEELGVRDLHFELFDAGHMAVEYRYPAAIRYLAERVA